MSPGLSLLLKVFLGQIVVASVVIIVLIKILDKRLKDNAIRQLEIWQKPEGDQNIYPVIVTAHKDLDPARKGRLIKATRKIFGEYTTPRFEIDKKLIGGLVIQIGSEVLEWSLKNRLERARRER